MDTLVSSQNTEAARRKIVKAAHAHFNTSRITYSFFEHGHWWLEHNNKTYSVCDAIGVGTTQGFDFEEIS
jgi:hypothetical protein